MKLNEIATLNEAFIDIIFTDIPKSVRNIMVDITRKLSTTSSDYKVSGDRYTFTIPWQPLTSPDLKQLVKSGVKTLLPVKGQKLIIVLTA